MPPPDRPRPDQATLKNLLSYLETSLDRAADAKPDPGRTEALHRLNRAEYRNAVRDLLALDIDVSAMLPADDVSYGFDNIAGVQRMSPTLMERYLAAAQKISSVAVGASPRAATTETFLVPPELQQNARVEGLPFGTRGGTVVRHTFPRDGVYSIRVQLTRYAGASFDEVPVFDEPQRLELSVDGTPVHVFELPPAAHTEGRGYSGANRRGLDADWYVRFPAKAGPRDLALTFLNRTPALLENLLEPFQRPAPGGPNGYYTTQKGAYLRSVEISGPYDATGAGNTPSRQRIFACRPRSAASESGCAKTDPLLAGASRVQAACRRRGSQTVLALYREGRAERDFELGIERAVEGLLVSPEFLYRIEREPRGASAPDATRIASAISSSPRGCRSFSGAASRMTRCSTRRSRASFRIRQDSSSRRGGCSPTRGPRRSSRISWGNGCFSETCRPFCRIPKRESDFDEDLRQGLRRETELFAGSILREDRSVLDLLTANYTFVNERLAKHYGIPHIRGPHFRRIERNDDRRRGLLGQGSVLAVTSFPHRTSPVVRGKWILENLLGTPLPPPPPDVPALEEKPNPGDEEKSMRVRIAQHRANPTCASCHATMDPLGLSLENFDMVGRWREVDEALDPIDASGTLPDGTKFDGPAGLRAVLMSNPDRFVRTVTEKMLTYALGRGLEHYDMPAVRKIVRDAAQEQLPRVVVDCRRRQQSALPDAEAAVMIITKMALAAADIPQRHRGGVRPSAARCDGAGIVGGAKKRRQADNAAWDSSMCRTAWR